MGGPREPGLPGQPVGVLRSTEESPLDKAPPGVAGAAVLDPKTANNGHRDCHSEEVVDGEQASGKPGIKPAGSGHADAFPPTPTATKRELLTALRAELDGARGKMTVERRKQLAAKLLEHNRGEDTFFTRLKQRITEAGVLLPSLTGDHRASPSGRTVCPGDSAASVKAGFAWSCSEAARVAARRATSRPHASVSRLLATVPSTVEYRGLRVQTEALVGAAAVATVASWPITAVKVTRPGGLCWGPGRAAPPVRQCRASYLTCWLACCYLRARASPAGVRGCSDAVRFMGQQHVPTEPRPRPPRPAPQHILGLHRGRESRPLSVLNGIQVCTAPRRERPAQPAASPAVHTAARGAPSARPRARPRPWQRTCPN
jgi:hypothetical protein